MILIISCLLFVGGYLFFYFYAFFLIGFSGGVLLLLIYGASIFPETSTLSKYIFLYGLFSFFIGFLCWIIDDIFCEYVQRYNLHIGWHVFTGLGGYLFAMFQVTLRAKPLKKEAILLLPWVGYDKVSNGYQFIGMNVKAKQVGDGLVWNETKSIPELFLPYIALR